MKKVVIGRVERHDSKQIEITTDFFLKKESKSVFQMDFYFYIPSNMKVDPKEHTEKKIYNNITNYLRIHVPPSFEQTIKFLEQFEYNVTHLYPKKVLQGNAEGASKKDVAEWEHSKTRIIQEIKLFACFVDSTLNKGMYKLNHKLKNKTPIDETWLHHLFKETLSSIEKISSFRKNFVSKMYAMKEVDLQIKEALKLTDEFISNKYISTLSSLNQLIKKNQIIDDYLMDIRMLLKNESRYHLDRGYLYIHPLSKSREKEKFSFRQGILKKYVYNVLYLDHKRIDREKFYRNVFGAMAASLAAVWAIMAEFQRIRWLQANENIGFNFTIPLAIGVLIYAFKDRIKELSRDFFYQKFKHKLPDYVTRLFYQNYHKLPSQTKENLIGHLTETIRYLREKQVPKMIMDLRYSNYRGTSMEQTIPEETILNYYKKVTIDELTINKNFPHVLSVRDIFRIDLSDFLGKLDDSYRMVDFYDNRVGEAEIQIPKVYHINILIKYSTYDHKDPKNVQLVKIQRARVILNKDGIVRVERVKPLENED